KYTWRWVGRRQTERHPVLNVSWNDAVAFCEWLSEQERKEGWTYRLPTEAEWEYACRAGTSTPFSCGDIVWSLRKHANLADASLRPKLKGRAYDNWGFAPWDDGCPFDAPVGSFRPNPWGLYDMHGNVLQWCQDRYGARYYRLSEKDDPQGPKTGKFRVVRGGQ